MLFDKTVKRNVEEQEESTLSQDANLKSREFIGRKKLWGTKRSGTAEKMRECIVKTVPKATSVEVKRVFKSEDGRVRWWLWLEDEESVLKLIDDAHFGDFWKIETRPPFLESVVVRVLGQH